MTSRFGVLLRQARLRSGMTQEQLAQSSEVGVRTIGGLESGERADPRPSTARRLADALGLAEDDHARLLAAAVGAADTPQVTRPATRNDLPGDIADFTGRAEETDRLLATIPMSVVVINAIDGMAGAGKTTLAVHIAHRLAEHYPDAQLFIDLHGHASQHEATDPAAALDVLLRALGLPGDQIPDGLDQRSSLWRAELAGRKALVVLDNAASAAQVRPLLPGSPGCLALVTSRHRLADLETARTLSLDVLPAEDAIALFGGIVGADRVAAQRESVAELVRLCGYLPLAIRIAAARSRSRPAWTVEYLTSRLREGQHALAELTTGDRSVAATFTLSYQQLTLDQQRLFRLLGLPPGPDIEAFAAASLIGTGVVETERLLENLVDAHLLQQPTPGRYRFHDLLHHHAHATALAEETEQSRQQAQRRLVEHYLHTAFTAERLREPHHDPVQLDLPADGCQPRPLDDESVASAWLVAEHPNLLAAQHSAVQHGWHTLVWQLARTLHMFHLRRGNLHDQLTTWRTGLASAQQSGDPATQAVAHRLFGNACTRAGLHTDAVGHLQLALALAEDLDDRLSQAHTHNTLAGAWGEQGDDRRALEHATHALRLYQTLDNPARKARALNAVGWYHARLRNYLPARAHCEAALALSRSHKYGAGEAATLDSLGYIAHRCGQHTQAMDNYQQALTLYRSLGNRYQEAATLERLGQAHHILGRHDQADSAWQQALQLYRAQGRQQDAERVENQLNTP